MSATVPNVVGEPEREARSPQVNAVEALCLACAVLIILWPLGFGWGVLGGVKAINTMAERLLMVVMLWMLIGSPLWHRDSAASLGVGSPARLWRMICDRKGIHRWSLIALVSGIFGGLLTLSFTNWPQVARFFRLPPEAWQWPQEPAHWVAMSGFSVVVAGFVAMWAIRYDNLVSSFGLALRVSAGFFIFAGTAAWLHRGQEAFARFETSRLLLDVVAYAFWGFLQQFAFTAYFSTRLRKGFGPERMANPVQPEREGWLRVCLGGLVCAFTFGPVVWSMVWMKHGADVPWMLLPIAMLFAFPAGALWTHFYLRNRRRICVATLSGSFFGLIHADSYGLVLVTMGLGTAIAYAAMEDRYRNLAVFGLVHGFLGSTFHKLFRDGGILQVDYRVGPWNVREPSGEVLIIPLLCVCGYALAALWAARYLRSRSPDNARVSSPPATSFPVHNPVPQ